MRELINVEFTFANEPWFDRFSWGFFWQKMEIAEFIFASGPILGIAEFKFAKKGKIRNNEFRNNLFRINLFSQ